MNIANIALIFVVVVVAFAAISHMIRKNKNEIVEEAVEIDDKTFTLDKMVKFVKQRLDEITKVNLYDIGLSEEELKRRSKKDFDEEVDKDSQILTLSTCANNNKYRVVLHAVKVEE